MTKLRYRMVQDMRLHGLSPTTQRTYLDAVRNLAKHYHRPPDQLSEKEIREFFIYLIREKCLASSTLRNYLYAIKFLYQKMLDRQWPVLNLIRV